MRLRILLLFLIIILSCGFTKHGHFTNANNPPKLPLEFQISGVYYTFKEIQFDKKDIRKYINVCFFFQDGTMFTESVSVDEFSIENVKKIFTPEYYKNLETSTQGIGAFTVYSDTIKFQDLVSNHSFGMDVVETYYVVARNAKNTIYKIKTVCDWCSAKGDNEMFDPPIKYNFLPLASKPDSSKAWFKHTKWYKKLKNER